MRVSLWVPCWTNYQTYQGNPCGVFPDLSSFIGSGVYPDLSSFTGSGVYPDLSSFTGSGVYPDLASFTGSGVIQNLRSLYQTIRPVRFTSQSIMGVDHTFESKVMAVWICRELPWSISRVSIYDARESDIRYENHETGLIQAKGPSGEGRRPKWRRTKPPSGEGWRPKWRRMKAQRQRHYQDY